MARRAVTSDTIARESDELAGFLCLLTKNMMRRASQHQRVLKPSGRRIRGITIIPNLWLCRDMTFYKLFDGEAVARPLTLAETLAWVRVGTIKARVLRALQATNAYEVPSTRVVP